MALEPTGSLGQISQSTGQSTSQGTGTPISWQTPQSQYDLMFAQQAAAMGANQYNWAQQQYGNLQGIANEAIPQYLAGSAAAQQLGTTMLGDYNQIYRPAMRQIAETAATYASPERIAANMGQAEAGATQAAAQGWQNTRAQLQAAGVDPSQGESAWMRNAANLAGGAAAAGAGTQARQATEQTGLGLQQQNINFGQTLPAGALNAINTAYGGQAGAVNTGATTTNTAANAFNSANQWYNTAMGIQPAPQGQQQQQTAQSTQQSTSQPMQGFGQMGNIGFGGGVVAKGG